MDTVWVWLGGLALLGFLVGIAIGKALRKRTTLLTIDPFISFAASLVAVSYACSVAINFAPISDFACDVLSGVGFSAAWLGATISGWSGMRLSDRRCIAVFISSLPPLAESIWRLLNHP
jgi:hypothetical protein